MKQQILFIHGAGKGAHEMDSKLAHSLQKALGSDYQVHNPPMPSEGDPKYPLWKDELTRQLKAIDSPLILAGHSLGGSFLLKYLSEEPVTKPLRGLFMASAPYFGVKDWDYDEFKLRSDFAKHLPEGLPISLYQCKDDEVVPFDHMAIYAKQLPQATTREVASGGHQLNDDLSVMAEDIKRLK